MNEIKNFMVCKWNKKCPLCDSEVTQTVVEISPIEEISTPKRFINKQQWQCNNTECAIVFRIAEEKKYMLCFTPERLETKTAWVSLNEEETIFYLMKALYDSTCSDCKGSVGHTEQCNFCISNPNIFQNLIRNYIH